MIPPGSSPVFWSLGERREGGLIYKGEILKKGVKMKTREIKITDLKPYENNPRRNGPAVDKVAASIKEFGFKVPIVVDKDLVIVCGHTRLKAAEKLGLDKVPCVVADDLTEDQIKAFRLADNKTAEFAEWDIEKLIDELDELTNFDISAFGFDLEALADELIPELEEERSEEEELERLKKEFEERMAAGELSEDDEEYQDFLQKFEAKKTTDDCYTPEVVYDAVADYVAKRYKLKRSNFVRPFVPGGDYEHFTYKKNSIVVDNPPFSIISQITSFYIEHGIRFFLWAPGLSVFTPAKDCTAICLNISTTYENGAEICTSFVTNLEPHEIRFKSEPELYSIVKKANAEFSTKIKKKRTKLLYPLEVVTASAVGLYSIYGIDFECSRSETLRVPALDAQREEGTSIFGAGYLISERKKAEREKAERAKAKVFKLSAREKELIRQLDESSIMEDKN